MEHKEKKNSWDSKLKIDTICSIRTHSKNRRKKLKTNFEPTCKAPYFSRKNNDITRDNWRQKRTRRGVIDRNYAKRNLVKNFDQTVEIESDDGMEQNHTMLTAEGKRK